jgi:hypothetical protein
MQAAAHGTYTHHMTHRHPHEGVDRVLCSGVRPSPLTLVQAVRRRALLPHRRSVPALPCGGPMHSGHTQRRRSASGGSVPHHHCWLLAAPISHVHTGAAMPGGVEERCGTV